MKRLETPLNLALFLKWKAMTELERKVYYFLFLWSLDRFISKVQVRLGERIANRYCKNGKCKKYDWCCKDCPLEKKPCSQLIKPRMCSIWFCDEILKKIGKKKRAILGIPKIQEITETLRFSDGTPNFWQLQGNIFQIS